LVFPNIKMKRVMLPAIKMELSSKLSVHLKHTSPNFMLLLISATVNILLMGIVVPLYMVMLTMTLP
jgi:hypothetical protein